ncbi:MAG: alanine dehydrogenase [Archaeoglobus sp.]|jgi:alanine dehydrogenase|nr:MAG: alanine dehydrogenase [Archaeoglobus sp.]
MQTLILTEDEIRSLLRIRDVMGVVEEAFRLYAECSMKDNNQVQMPPKVYLTFDDGDLRAMPALVGNYAGVKWVNSHPLNKEKRLPTVMALLILNDPKTGFPLAVMDATYITCVRTGAAGGIAAKYLARKDSNVFGFVGCGTQAYYQLEALMEIFDVNNILAYDINSSISQKFIKHCSKLGIDAEVCECKRVCRCDVLTTTTPSTNPVVKNEWVNAGIHINAIGADAPGKRELDEKILLRAKIVVDDLRQAVHGGEVNFAISNGILKVENIHATIGEVVAGIKPGRESDEEITIFDSTGLAIQDIATASVVFEMARERRIGEHIRFFR